MMKASATNLALEGQVEQYALERPLYESYAAKLRTLLVSLLDAHGLKYQVVEARAKEVDSFREKVTRAGKFYENPISDLPDLCGARVIVYYADDVSKVNKMIADEFTVVEEEMSHQQDSFDADRFGYLSVHFVVKLNQSRISLAEWKFADKFRAEIQVRTVIQHAWSAVSHALQYKQETAIPSRLRRRLFRIAGLFELADEEFVGIRDAKGKLVDAAAMAFAAGDRNIPITSESLIELIADDEAMNPVIELANKAGLGVKHDDEDAALPEIYELSRRLRLNSIDDIISLLKDNNQQLFSSVKKFMPKGWVSPRDFLLFFVLLRKASHLVSNEELHDFGWAPERAENLLLAVKSVS
jgi:putative GTP pyrophosphokinase